MQTENGRPKKLAAKRGVEIAMLKEVSREVEQRVIAAGGPVFAEALERDSPLDRYAQMAARATTCEAISRGTINGLREHGVTLSQLSARNAEDFCRYCENAIVSLDGPDAV